MPPSFDATAGTGAERLSIAVAGSNDIALEVCRLGRAAGHDMMNLSASGPPDRDQPWIHGVEWLSSATDPDRIRDRLEASDVVVIPSSAADSDAVVAALAALDGQAGPRRAVLVRTDADGSLQTPACAETVELDLPPLREVPAEADDRAHGSDGDGIPVGQAAMAILRAAVEPDHDGHLSPEEVAELGRAVMIQS